ncbi:MAG: RsmB/NOP family class I SAM-dependent RNA methyltransferase [Sphingomonadales bacterium]|nr:RsmB/NOP family class I SAM-dependent RNA methyltransferase [Sphingomonadales bacterium]
MTPSARLQAAIDLVDAILAAARTKGAPADRIAQTFFTQRRYAGSKDRRAVRELAWNAIRRFGEAPVSARAAFVALADEDAGLAGLFDGTGYGPAALAIDEPKATGGPIPGWLLPEISSLLESDEYASLLDRAPLDIRVNTLKSTRDAVLAELGDGEALSALPDAIRLPAGYAVEQHPLFAAGVIEVQDLGSQLIAAASQAKPGQIILDLCAGAGGKTLALAASMQGEGRLIASDTNRDRLSKIPARAERDGADGIECKLLNPMREKEALEELKSQCDLVLIDAPCSGSGTWRRNPETRWRLQPDDLERLIAEQARLLELATHYVKPGGAMVYAVCSIFEREGRVQVETFLRNNPNWRAEPAGISAGRADGPGTLLTPAHDASDGFYLARLRML